MKMKSTEGADLDVTSQSRLLGLGQEKSPTVMDRRMAPKLGLFTLVGFIIVITQIFCEVSKQTANYSLQYYNQGIFPIPKTFLVVLTEATKLTAIILLSKGQCPLYKYGISLKEIRSSAKYLLPSIFYGVNNNLYLLGLTMVAPPIWNILISVRTVITACVYKFILKRSITKHQMFGAFLIVISLAIAKAPALLGQFTASSGESNIAKAAMAAAATAAQVSNSSTNLPASVEMAEVNALPIQAVLLALTAACISVSAAVYTERLFKSGGGSEGGRTDTFLDQQFWLYLYGSLVASIIHISGNPTYFVSSFVRDFASMSTFFRLNLILAVAFGGLGGLVVASILKHLDNVVKEYSASTANIVTAAVSSFLFPDKFRLTLHMMGSMATLLTGIFFYERFKAAPPSSTKDTLLPQKNELSLETLESHHQKTLNAQATIS